MSLHSKDDLWACSDCGINAWYQVEEDGRVVHEDFYVHDDLWDSVCPDDRRKERELWPNGMVDDPAPGEGGGFVICIGCFEARLGRQLTRGDFEVPPATPSVGGLPPSTRFLDRWESL